MSDVAFKLPAAATGTDAACSVEGGTSRIIPWSVLAEFNFPASTLNSSTANISAGGNFTGGVESTIRQPAAQVAVFADQPYRVEFIQYSDSLGARETSRVTFEKNANEGFCESMALIDYYFRVIVTNRGASATTQFTIQTTQGPINPGPKAVGPYGGLPVEIYGRGEELKAYGSAVAVVPTTLTTGLNYWWIRNTSATKRIKITSFQACLIFTGTAAATRSGYLLKKFTGCTATTGTALTAEKMATAGAATVCDTKWSATGGTLTAATVSTGSIASIGHANQLTANVMFDLDLERRPIVLTQNEGVVLQSDGAVVLGTAAMISVGWVEE